MSDGGSDHEHQNMQSVSSKKRSSGGGGGGGGGSSNHRDRGDRGGGIDKEHSHSGGGHAHGERGYDGPTDDQSMEQYRQLLREKDDLDPKEFPIVHRLIEKELSRLSRRGGSDYLHQHETVDLYNDPPITLNIKCFPPTKEFPNFNYAGRIIGPKGAYLKAIMRETNTKMVLLGGGVMKDKEREEELKKSSDPKYFHLRDDMHVAITVTSPAADAYSKAAKAIDCLRKQVVSDNKELLSLPWIVRVLEDGHGPPQAYQQLETLNRGRYGHGGSPPPPSSSYRRSSGGHGHHGRGSGSHGYYDDHPPSSYGPSGGGGGGRSRAYSPAPPPPTYSSSRGGHPKDHSSARYYDNHSPPPPTKRSRPPTTHYDYPDDYDSGDSYQRHGGGDGGTGRRSVPSASGASGRYPPPHRK